MIEYKCKNCGEICFSCRTTGKSKWALEVLETVKQERISIAQNLKKELLFEKFEVLLKPNDFTSICRLIDKVCKQETEGQKFSRLLQDVDLKKESKT